AARRARPRGADSAFEETRRPGFGPRFRPPIDRLRSVVYLRWIVSVLPGLSPRSAISYRSMNPPGWRIFASASLSFDDGIEVTSWKAMLALRILVRRSAMGSVI